MTAISITMPEVNPEILHWARETAGLQPAEAARMLGVRAAHGKSAEERLVAYERGESQPTQAILRNMAKRYRRPLVVFYLDNIPPKGDRGHDFRMLPALSLPQTDALLDPLVRDLYVRQGLLRAAMEDDEDNEPLWFVGHAKLTDGVDDVVASIREAIHFDLQRDYRSAINVDEAFKALRARVEEAGVFVLLIKDLGSYHTTVDLEVFRGIALADPIAPFIVININDAKAAWSFTLLHELAHLWLGASGVSGHPIHESGIERFCNDVASRLLLSESELDTIVLPRTFDVAEVVEIISEFSSPKKISRAMAAYRLYRGGRISHNEWLQLRNWFRAAWVKRREEHQHMQGTRKGGPDSNIIARYRIGPGLLATTQALARSGALSTTKAGAVLGVKPTRVGTILGFSDGGERPVQESD